MFDNLNVQGVLPVSVQTSQKRQKSREKKASERRREKKKRELIGIFFKLTSVRPLPADFQKCQNVRCRRVFKRLCHVCMTLRAKPQKSDWLKWWRKLPNLTNRTVYQNEVLKTMPTGLTSPSLPSPHSLKEFEAWVKCVLGAYDWFAIERHL